MYGPRAVSRKIERPEDQTRIAMPRPNKEKQEEQIMITTLKAQKRDTAVKAKKLRRDGFTTGVLYGREMEESMPLQFDTKDAMRFIGKNTKGAQVVLDLGDKKVSAIVKDIDYNSMQRQIMSLDFQALVKGEKISTSVPVKFENAEIVQGIVEQELSEIHYKAEPDQLLDTIVIDFKEISPEVRDMHVKDLHLEEKGIHLITPEDDTIFHIADYAKAEETDDAEEEAAAE